MTKYIYIYIVLVSDAKSCNCRDKVTCPLQGNCLIDSIIYRGNITTSNKEDENNYIGLNGKSIQR